MTERSSALAHMLHHHPDLPNDSETSVAATCHWLTQATVEEVNRVLDAVILCSERQETTRNALLSPILGALVQRQLHLTQPMTDDVRNRLVLLYQILDDARGERWRILQWLASSASPADLAAFVDLLIEGPPADWQTAAAAFAPLFQRRQYDPGAIFPRLLEALQHVAVAAPILDLANYLLRRLVVTEHPAACRVDQLIQLLDKFVAQLNRLERKRPNSAETNRQLNQQVEDSVALVVALCDALALIQDERAIDKLRLAMELKHRRIRTEAAAALAKFDDAQGTDTLVEMAREPVVRLRVLTDAKELGIEDRIDATYRTEEARAEALIALELSQATYFGIPPQKLELIDFRSLYWPGFDQPQDCFLFRFIYQLETATYSNIAIAGPAVHTFVSDLNDIPIDDIYAAYAGWQAEHAEIYEVGHEAWTDAQRVDVDRLTRRLRDAGYRQIDPVMLSYFFGDQSLVATAMFDQAAGTAIVDQQSIDWQPLRNPDRPIGPVEALCIIKGRRLLGSFN